MARRKKRNWIKKAIKHKGALRRWAEKMHFITESGDINLREAERWAREHHDEHRLRQILLAKNLRKFRKRK